MVNLKCRHFTGYKPCARNSSCTVDCPVQEKAEPRILVIHLEALGAVLRATVVLRAMRREWPNAHVTWITSPLASALLENNPFIDRIIKNNNEGVLALSVLSFDYAFCIDKSLTAAGLLKVPKFVGESRGFGADSNTGAIVPLNQEALTLYKIGLSDHEKFFVNRKSESQLIVESLGLQFQNDEYVFEFAENEKILRSSKTQTIGLNTGCSSTIPYKKLTVQGWVELSDILQRDFPEVEIYILGGPEDTQRNLEIKALRPKLNLTPTDKGLREGFRSLDLCDVVVTGDSLGMHMAIALRKWVVAWFGPTCAHEIDFYGRGSAVLTSAPCSPCWKRKCDKPLMCYDQVNFHEIAKEVRRGFANKSREKLFAPSARKLPEANL